MGTVTGQWSERKQIQERDCKGPIFVERWTGIIGECVT